MHGRSIHTPHRSPLIFQIPAIPFQRICMQIIYSNLKRPFISVRKGRLAQLRRAHCNSASCIVECGRKCNIIVAEESQKGVRICKLCQRWTTQQPLTIRSTDLVYKIIYGSTHYSVKILLLQDSFPGNWKALIIMSRRWAPHSGGSNSTVHLMVSLSQLFLRSKLTQTLNELFKGDSLWANS